MLNGRAFWHGNSHGYDKQATHYMSNGCHCCPADLTRLDLRHLGYPAESELTDGGIQHLSTLNSLQYLNLAGHRTLTTNGLAFLSQTTGLTSLCLAGEASSIADQQHLCAAQELCHLGEAPEH